MNTIIYSALGIILLVAISLLFSMLENARSSRASKRLTEFRKALQLKSKWLLNDQHKLKSAIFDRNPGVKLTVFPPDGGLPVIYPRNTQHS